MKLKNLFNIKGVFSEKPNNWVVFNLFNRVLNNFYADLNLFNSFFNRILCFFKILLNNAKNYGQY